MKRLLVPVVVLLAGCGAKTPVAPRADAADGAPSASAAASASPSASRADKAPTSTLPAAFASLGAPCPEGASHDRLCGTDGKVAAIFVPVDHALDIPPASAEILRHEPRTTLPDRGHELKVGLEGERLWVLHVTCGACRRIMGTSFVGDLGRLTPAQLVDVQRRLGVASEAPLKDGAAWRAFYRSLAAPAPARSAP